MTRTVAREIAIQLSFAAQLAGDDARETADTFFSREYFATLAEEDPLFLEYPDEKQLDYIRRLTGLVYDHMYELNHMIEKYARGWRLERISRVAAAIMRCAMCEILYMDDVPNAAAINEAVELAKGYEEPETVAFINGVLGSFVRGEVEKRNLTTMTDFYELTMSAGYLDEGYVDKIAVFDMFFRRVPDGGGYAVMAGLQQFIDAVDHLKFTGEDIDYLRSTKAFDEKFLTYLANFKLHCNIWAIEEGMPIFPQEPIVTVEGPAIECQLLETLLLPIAHQLVAK